jgi:hypothetical protein
MPETGKVFRNFERGVCPFKALPIFHEQERVSAYHRRAVFFNQLLSDRTLHRSEYESTGRVSLDNEVDCPVTEIAHAIKDHDVAVIHSFSTECPLPCAFFWLRVTGWYGSQSARQ